MDSARIGVLDLLTQIKGSADIAIIQANCLPENANVTQVRNASDAMYFGLRMIRNGMQCLAACYETRVNDRSMATIESDGNTFHQPSASPTCQTSSASDEKPVQVSVTDPRTANTEMQCSGISGILRSRENTVEIGMPAKASLAKYRETDHFQDGASQTIFYAEEMVRHANETSCEPVDTKNVIVMADEQFPVMEVKIGDTQSVSPSCIEETLDVQHTMAVDESPDAEKAMLRQGDDRSLGVNIAVDGSQSTSDIAEMLDLTSGISRPAVREEYSDTNDDLSLECKVHNSSNRTQGLLEFTTGVGTPIVAEESTVEGMVTGEPPELEAMTDDLGTVIRSGMVLRPRGARTIAKEFLKKRSRRSTSESSCCESVVAETDSPENDIAIPRPRSASVTIPLLPNVSPGSRKIYLAGVAKLMPILFQNCLIEPYKPEMLRGNAVQYILFDSEQFRPGCPFPQDIPYCTTVSELNPTVLYHRYFCKLGSQKEKWILTSLGLRTMFQERSLPRICCKFRLKLDEVVLFLGEEDTCVEVARRYGVSFVVTGEKVRVREG